MLHYLPPGGTSVDHVTLGLQQERHYRWSIMVIRWFTRHSFHVYQHRRTTAAGFHKQNMWDILAKTLEYRSKYIHILNPTVREDIVHPLTAVTNCQICFRLKKAAERTKSRGCLFKVVDIRGPANFGIFVMWLRLTCTPLACRRWQRSSILFFSIKYSRLLYFCDVRCGYYVLQ